IAQLLLVQVLHHFPDILGLIAGGDQESVFRFYYDQIVYAQRCDKFSGRVNVIAPGIQREPRFGGDQVVILWLAFGRMMIMQRGPRTQIIPSEICGKADDAGVLLSLARAWFEHGIINADVLAPGIEPGKRGGKFLRAEGGRNLLQQCRGLRQMLQQRFGQGTGTPQEHAAVPEIVSGFHEFSGARCVRLFRKASHPQRIVLKGGTGLDVTVAYLGPCGTDSKDYNIFSRGRDLNSLLQDLAIPFFVGDYVVGRKQANHGIGIAVHQDECSQTDGWGCVASYRFGQNPFRAKPWKLAYDLAPQMLVGDDPETRRGSQGQQPAHGLLDHGQLSVERQQLLGKALPAQGPEASAAPAGENHGMKAGLSHSLNYCRFQILDCRLVPWHFNLKSKILNFATISSPAREPARRAQMLLEIPPPTAGVLETRRPPRARPRHHLGPA